MITASNPKEAYTYYVQRAEIFLKHAERLLKGNCNKSCEAIAYTITNRLWYTLVQLARAVYCMENKVNHVPEWFKQLHVINTMKQRCQDGRVRLIIQRLPVARNYVDYEPILPDDSCRYDQIVFPYGIKEVRGRSIQPPTTAILIFEDVIERLREMINEQQSNQQRPTGSSSGNTPAVNA